MKELIKNIHKSDIYGAFIEAGCAVPVAFELLSVSGASDTVYMSECPYSKTYFKNEYVPGENVQNYRSVSPQYISSIINSEKFRKIFDSGEINTIYASSFQVGEENDKSTHGWIGLKYKDLLKYYHVSIHESLGRDEYIKRIGITGLKLLYAKNSEIPENCDVDIVLNEDFTPDYERTFDFISNISDGEMFSVFFPDRIDRLESITRNYNSLILFKGNFNPVQNAHINIIKQAGKIFTQAGTFFMISADAVQKGKQNTDSVIQRIKLLFELEYGVIICNNKFFRNNINYLRNKFPEKNTVIIAMGLDTFNRLLLDYTDDSGKQNIDNLISDFNNVKFFCMNREGGNIPDCIKNISCNNIIFETSEYEELSSTKIREFLKENMHDEIKRVVPAKVFDLIIKDKWS